MLLEIDDWRTVGDLQYRFNKCFSNLQLQLFTTGSKNAGGMPLPGACSLEHIRRVHRPGVISIKSWFTCREVEQLLLEHYGLHARVVQLQGGRENWHPQYKQSSLKELNETANVNQPQAAMARDEEDAFYGW